MVRYRQAGAALVVSAALACGCVSGRALELHPGLENEVARAGSGEASSLSRAQKPDMTSPYNPVVRTPVQPLDAPPERSAEVAGDRPAARISAIVNGEAILDEELHAASYQALARISNLPQPERARQEAEIKKDALRQLVEREVVLHYAFVTLKARNEKALNKLKEIATKEFERQWLRPVRTNLNVKNEQEFKEFLKSQGLNLAMVQRQWERNFMAMEYLRNRVMTDVDKVGHSDIEEYYNQHAEDFKVTDTVEWQDLLIDISKHATREAAQTFAQTLAARIRQGEDFIQLGRQFDNGDSTLRNRRGAGSKRGEIRPPECEAALFAAKEGSVLVVETDRTFHVIKVLKRQYAGVQPFDEKAQKEIRDKLRNEVASREMKRLVNRLKSDAIIIYAKEMN